MKGMPFTKRMCNRSRNCDPKRGRALAWANLRDWLGGGHRHSLGKARKERGYFERKPALFPKLKKV